MIAILILISISILCGLSESVMDVLNFRFYDSIFKNLNPKFWNKTESSSNKNKHGNKLTRLMFQTILVFTTDAWHLFKSLHTFLLFCIVIVSFLISSCAIINFMLYFIGAYLIKKLAFEIGYNFIFTRKK